MLNPPQPVYAATELDQDLLSAHFEVHTNWHVITGPPSCGKTTLINLLAKKGFKTVVEGARLYMERQVARGRTVEEIHCDVRTLQCGIKDTQLEIEGRLDPAEFAFLDRALPDSLAWHRIFGLNPNEFLCDCFKHRYASVCILDRLPLELDSLRFNNEAIIGFCDEWHTRDYHALGYNLVRVPVLPPDDRLTFVLDRLSEQGFM